MKINFIGGNGVMGKTHIKYLENAGHEIIITGRNSEISPKDAAKNSDLTIFSVPLDKTLEVIKEVGPHVNGAMLDLSTVKEAPVNEMLKYAKDNVEVAGLHPMYGYVDSVSGRTIAFCKTGKTGKICEEFLDIFSKEGAKIFELNPKEHDIFISQTIFNRRDNLKALMLTLQKSGFSAKDSYELAPPPFKLLMELFSRQNTPEYTSLQDGAEILLGETLKKVRQDFSSSLEEIKSDGSGVDKKLDEFISEISESLKESARKRI